VQGLGAIVVLAGAIHALNRIADEAVPERDGVALLATFVGCGRRAHDRITPQASVRRRKRICRCAPEPQMHRYVEDESSAAWSTSTHEPPDRALEPQVTGHTTNIGTIQGSLIWLDEGD
jgi:hypothetical protein